MLISAHWLLGDIKHQRIRFLVFVGQQLQLYFTCKSLFIGDLFRMTAILQERVKCYTVEQKYEKPQ